MEVVSKRVVAPDLSVTVIRTGELSYEARLTFDRWHPTSMLSRHGSTPSEATKCLGLALEEIGHLIWMSES